MPSEKSVSFRTHLLSNSTDLIEEIGLQCARTAKLIAGIVSQLAAYTEEGVPLAPSVFICNSISSLLQRAGAGEFLLLSDEIAIESAGPKILKAAAPLCGDNWRIFVERSADGERCRFGVFCGASDPSALTVDEVVLADLDQNFPIVRIMQSSTNKVEVSTNAGSSIEFRFNDDVDISVLNSRANIRDLSGLISGKVSTQDGLFTAFADRVLTAAIRNCHGTLIAVVAGDGVDLPEPLMDAVAIQPPLDLYERFRLHHEEGKTALSVSRLQSAGELVSGFIGSDGITIFNEAGLVIGFRAFVKSKASDATSSGGARTRAFAALADLVGHGLVGAFFRSQDGRTELRPLVGAGQ